MDVNSSEDYGTSSMSSPRGDISAGKWCQSVESHADWRSCEQVDNGTPSTSPPFWDTDDDECGPRPSELYGKFSWKIENFSQITKRELRSDVFEVGCYKWHILVYPQGCDVCNHLSLFLCVANHEKLLPGWSHFAQFTIAVVNKDRKRNKCSVTLHRFWKKEHDWGWKQFMELSKVLDGFLSNDTLVIKAKVQVIREKAHRLFRCLDYQYRRKLVRLYLSNVKQIFRRFLEDRKSKLSKLIEDRMKWSSFCAFWLGIDQNSRQHMSRDKSETILRVVVKHFFVEKEVTSTLVMDSLHSGLRTLECQSKSRKGRLAVEMDVPGPMVRVDMDMFILADDVLSLLERVTTEPLPFVSTTKDDKGSQNRAKDACFGEESIENDERRLTELGRRTMEMFVLAHIFSRIEVAYQEAVALKRQEELIREEEEAWQAENELKAKRNAADKDKRTKKKQTKQKRNNHKNKEKQRDLKYDSLLIDNKPEEDSLAEIASTELSITKGTVISDGLDTPVEIETTEVHRTVETSSSKTSNEQQEKPGTVMDDSSSTCSTDSISSVIPNGHCNGYTAVIDNNQTPNRARNHGDKSLKNHSSVASHGDKTLDGLISTHQAHEADVVFPKRSTARDHLLDKKGAASPSHKKTFKVQRNEEKLASSSPTPVRRLQPISPQAKQSSRSSTATITNSASTPIPASSLIKDPPSTALHLPKSSMPRHSGAPTVPPPVSRPTISSAPSTPQSYRNAIIFPTKVASTTSTSATFLPPPPRSLTFGSVKAEALQSEQQHRDDSTVEEFPHIDIINDLLNEEQNPYYAQNPNQHVERYYDPSVVYHQQNQWVYSHSNHSDGAGYAYPNPGLKGYARGWNHDL
ncbi:hypothetical protein HPP92_015885 [Vanilla planifolia]|uniref:MATH domain-containing protein n=1 Tax=Vanilla planifolia TaxID=51239 RepID=A0A835QM13_VANPL|nr:hypothetical protein HPP92_015885 [Vanilla planifolia]